MSEHGSSAGAASGMLVAAQQLGAEQFGAEHVAAQQVGAEQFGAEHVAAQQLGAEQLGADHVAAQQVGGASGGPDMSSEPGVSADLGRSSWPEIPTGALVLVPVGSTEQHGPHLPLNTDSVIAQRVAAEAAKLLMTERPERPVLLAPTIVYGASGEHAGFPGTVSIGHEALRLVLVEMVRSLALWAERIVFVNGHGGNVATLASVVDQMRGEGHAVSWLGCDIPGGDAHAGYTETSLMLYLAPDDVRLSAAVAGDTRPIAEIMPELMARGVKAVSPSGVLGDPAGATPEKGRATFETMVSDVIRRIYS